MTDQLVLAQITFDFPAWEGGRVQPSQTRCLVNDGELPPQTSDAVRQELARLKGSWRVVEIDGHNPSAGRAGEGCLVMRALIAGDRLRLHSEVVGGDGKVRAEGVAETRLEIDPAGPVRRMTLVGKASGREDRQIGVYELEGQTLRISTTSAEREFGVGRRPVDFRPGPYARHSVLVLRRE